ncbi:LANO_0H23486g1_1 [Lachancea nothofagi CBS 11611]|uniref:LANO_0H23486g1_1 n=1 Tax=Lachancea nothofagi CBS 11611 TaxID=1266666 RepID=A0A1G4KNS5_9SACH|nr:LANO_0H23486g1_1 [Lachancea nothofagi CBS 11611]
MFAARRQTAYSFTRLLRYSRSLHSDIAFAFDIDGVLLRSKEPIPGASEALKLCQEHKIPFILLTNGGGTLENQRTAFMSDALRLSLSPSQIIQSHTPFKTLVSKFKKVLAVGSPTVRDVAETYGFEKVVHPMDIVRYEPSIAPFSGTTKDKLMEISREIPGLDKDPFEAILVFNDPRDWGADIQIILDILNSDSGMLNTMRQPNESDLEKPSVPIYFSNNDLVWANQYTLNRIGQGAFRTVIETLYSELNSGARLQNTIIGKPTKVTYDFAHHILINWREKLIKDTKEDIPLPSLGVAPETSPFRKVFMVGDNPASDIIGAHNYGWSTCLVRTGVYRDGDPLPCKPTMICDDALSAVRRAIETCD